MSSFSYFYKARVFLGNLTEVWLNEFKKRFRKFYRGQHQLTSTTEFNRYPELFTEAKAYAQSFHTESLSILSYGCSTGEECFTLKSYFPASKIIGADINKSNLRTAAKKNINNDVKFILSTEENLIKEGKYHMIFCLSVLCRWDDTKYVSNCKNIYPFEKFQETLVMLSEMLVPGGYLIIYNSNFRLEDTVLVKNFIIKPTPSVTTSGFVYKFDSNNNRLDENHSNCIYQKIL
jgi:hypothetical protein